MADKKRSSPIHAPKGPKPPQAPALDGEGVDNELAQAALASEHGQASGGGGDPIDAATSGGGEPLPFLSTLEERFGTSLSHVRAHVGRPEIRPLHAAALSRGDDVVFADANPDLETVAEEVAHTFQPASAGQALSAPSDPSEGEAADAARRVARGEHVDPSGLTTAGAAVQRKYRWWNPWSWGDDKPASFQFSATDKASEAPEALPQPKREINLNTAVYVVETSADLLKLAPDAEKSTAAWKGLPLVTREQFTVMEAEATKKRDEVVAGFITALDGKGSLVKVKQGVTDAITKYRADEATQAILPTLYDEPKVFSHPKMIEIQELDPTFVLTVSRAFDPLTELKALLKAKGPDAPEFWTELTAWSTAYPDHGKRATADKEIMELIARGQANAAGNQALDAVDPTKSKSGLLLTAMNPSAGFLLGARTFGLDPVNAVNQTMGEEDSDQIRILQILMNGGAEDESPRGKLDRALADGDEVAFFAAWPAVMRDAKLFDAIKLDAVFFTDVQEKLGAVALERVRIDLAGGPLGGGSELELSKSEREQVKKHSNDAAARLRSVAEATYVFSRSGDLLEPLQRWGPAVHTVIAREDGSVAPPRLAEAQATLFRAFKAMAGRELGPYLDDQMKSGDRSSAAAIIGTGAAAAPSPDAPYLPELSAQEEDATDAILQAASTQLAAEFAEWSVHESVTGYWTGKNVGTDDGDVVALLVKAENDVRSALQPAEQTTDTFKAWREKTRTALARFPDLYAPFGNIATEIAEHVWDPGMKRRCQEIIGLREPPASVLVDGLLAEAQGADAFFLEEALRTMREQIRPDVEQLSRLLGSGEKGSTEDGVFSSSTLTKLTAIADGFDARRKSLASLKELDPSKLAVLPSFLQDMLGTLQKIASDKLPADILPRLLDEMYREYGGDLAHAITLVIPDATLADPLLEKFGLPDAAATRIPEDTALLGTLDQIEHQAPSADAAPTEEQLEAADAAKARVKKQVKARQHAAVRGAALFNEIETGDDLAEKVKKAKAVATIEAIWEAPIASWNAESGCLEERQGVTLFEEVYLERFGIPLGQHVGMRVAADERAKLTEALGQPGLVITSAPTPNQDRDAVAASLSSFDALDVRVDVDAKDFVDRAWALHKVLIRAREVLNPGGIGGDEIAAAAAIYVAPQFAPIIGAIYLWNRAAEPEHVKAQMSVAVADLLAGSVEAKLVREAYLKTFGTTVDYQINAIYKAGTSEAKSKLDVVNRRETSYVDKLIKLAGEKRTDEVFESVFTASDADKKAVLASGEALAELRRLGPKPYDRIYRSLTGQLTLGQMLRSRDGDSDDYDWVLTEVYGKTKMKMGWGEDGDGMKKDVTLFLKALKAKIAEAKAQYVVVDGDNLWNITKARVGDPKRWPELYDLNKAVIGNDPDLILTNQTLRLPPSWIDGLVSTSFKNQCRELMDDIEVRSVIEPLLSADDKMEMQLLIADGGTLSGTHQVLVDMKGSGTDGAILDHIKKMTDEERAAAVADPRFLAKVMHDLRGDELDQALKLLHGKQAHDGLTVMQAKMSEQGGITGKDTSGVLDELVGLSREEMVALSTDSRRLAELQVSMGGPENADAKLTRDMMKDVRETLGADSAAATEKDPVKKAVAEQRAYLLIKHKYALIAVADGGASKLVERTQAAYAERGEITHPTDKERKLYVWGDAERTKLWDGIKGPIQATWGNARVNEFSETVQTVGAGTAAVGMASPAVVGLLAPLGLAIADTASREATRDADGNVDDRTWAQVVEQGVRHQVDPATVRLGKAMEWSHSQDDIKGAISGAGTELVITRWSNVDKPDKNGRSLRTRWLAWALARQAYRDAEGAKAPEPELTEKKKAMHLAEHAFEQFALGTSDEVTQALSDDNGGLTYFTSSTKAELLGYRETVIDRILALSSEDIAVHFGIGTWEKDEATGATSFKRNDKATVTGADGAPVQVDVGAEDVDRLMGESRKIRSKHDITQEKVKHQLDTRSFADAFGDEKSQLGATYEDYAIEFYAASDRKEGEEVARVTDEEAKSLNEGLAKVGKSIDDYKAAKKKVADWTKKIVGTAIAVISAVFTGPAGPSLIASILIAGGTAAVNVAIDTATLGNDYDTFKQGIPHILESMAMEGLTQGLTKGWGELKDSWPALGQLANDNMLLRLNKSIEETFKAMGPAGAILKDVLKDGVVKPTLDVATKPLMHFLDPEALKWGSVSAYNESRQMFLQQLANLPEEIKKQAWDAFLKSSQDQLLELLTGKKEDEKGDAKPIPGVDGVKIVPKAPDEASFWAAMKKQLGEQWEKEKEKYSKDELKKAAIGYLISTGVLVVTSDRPLNSLDAAIEALATEKLNYLIHDAKLSDFLAAAFPYVATFATGTANKYAAARNERSIWEKVKQDEAQLSALPLPADLQGLAGDDLKAAYTAWLKANAHSVDLSDAGVGGFQDFLAQVQTQVAHASGQLTAEQKVDFAKWVLEDPTNVKQRALDVGSFKKNYAAMTEFREGTKHLIDDLPTAEEKRYAEMMLTTPGTFFDMMSGKATAPSLGTADGLKAFRDGIAKTKSNAALALKTDVPADKKDAWEAFVRQMNYDKWTGFSFMPTDANATAEVESLYQAFLHLQS